MYEEETAGQASGSDLTFTIYTQRGDYTDEEIDAGLIIEIMDSFEKDLDNFIVIEPSAPIGNSIYMQSILSPDDPSDTVVELRLQYTETSFKHYCYQTADKGEAARMLIDYWALQKLPDWTSWRDMTDEF